MKIPEEIDLYDWYGYSFYRAVLGLPIPSPRVWDNAGKLGFEGGKYMKEIYFEADFFEPSLYTNEDLTSYVKEKYGNELRLEKGNGKLMKFDRSNHKFVRTKDNNHLLLNFESFKKVKSLSDDFNFQKIYQAIEEIKLLARFKDSRIDTGYISPTFPHNYLRTNNKNEKLWILLNKSLEKDFNSNKDPIELLYDNVYKYFDYPSKKLWELNETLKNDFWFVDMFTYSFKAKTFRWLKGDAYSEESFINQFLPDKKRISINQENYEEEIDNDFEANLVTPKKKLKNKVETTVFRSKKSSFPVWLPLITIPLIFVVSRYIASFQIQQPRRVTPQSQPSLDICQLCRITDSCDTLPQCTSKQKKCEWKQTWDGKIIEECSSY